ncbi:FAD dependent oxidoreductase domain-containing protein [Sarocladium implicatum]|nr:FAD dependent oxidoreductase domain-containing protein [Sarocladium implicatum]
MFHRYVQLYPVLIEVSRGQCSQVPDGSSVDISRVIRFDYGDDVYLNIAYEAYLKWTTPKYKDIFFPSPFIVSSSSESAMGRAYTESCTAALTKRGLPWKSLEDAEAAKSMYETLTGNLAQPGFFGYTNRQAGWADAQKAIAQLRDDCLELGVSFISGRAGTVVRLETGPGGKITGARTLQGTVVQGDLFILSAGAWASSLVPFHNSTISTGQVLGYIKLTGEEMIQLQNLPIYINFATGWFNFPPHPDTKMLKIAIHGWGYTREPDAAEKRVLQHQVSSPPLASVRERRNFAPEDGITRLREGLKEILPELADRPFDRLALCWYTDTPTGDFIMDYHPDYENLFISGGGSGHAFKFLPILGGATEAEVGQCEGSCLMRK